MAAKKKTKPKKKAEPKPIQSKKRLAREQRDADHKTATDAANKKLDDAIGSAKQPLGKGSVAVRVIARNGFGTPDGDWHERGEIIKVSDKEALRLRGSGLAEEVKRHE